MSSLRLALKRSMEDAGTDTPAMASKKNKGMLQILLPEALECKRNNDPAQIDTFGFVELASVFTPELAGSILSEGRAKLKAHDARTPREPYTRDKQRSSPVNGKGKSVVEETPDIIAISNAMQATVSPELTKKIEESIRASETVVKSMSTVFGQVGREGRTSNYAGFELETPKLLITRPGSNPQIPHADDHCTSCLFGIVHLRDGQESTRMAPYSPINRPYPTGITVQCENPICGRHEQLPDEALRRGVHLTDEQWTCGHCGGHHIPYDFEGDLLRSFGELLTETAVYMCSAYAGPKTQNAGCGLLSLPTVVHRGPGNPATSRDCRYVLFFTLRPIYCNVKKIKELDATKIHHRYNPDLQIHAPCLLYNQLNKVKQIYRGYGMESNFRALAGLDDGRAAENLREENRRLREKLNKILGEEKRHEAQRDMSRKT